MPKRSNDFQKLIYLVRTNLADGATVTESKMMRDRLTKRFREVDVVIEGKVGSHAVVVCIECRDHRRVADVAWVEQMKAKHERLATNALLLASRSGFTSEAARVAGCFGIEVFSMDDVEPESVSAMLERDSTVWLKSVSVTPARVLAEVAVCGHLPAELIRLLPETTIFVEDRATSWDLQALVERLLQTPKTTDQLVANAHEGHRSFSAVWSKPVDSNGRPLCIEKIEPRVMRSIESLRIEGPCTVEIGRFGMRRSRLGNLEIEWTKARFSGQDVLAVVNKSSEGSDRLAVDFSGQL